MSTTRTDQRKRPFRAAIALATAVPLLAACAGSAPDDGGEVVAGGSIVIGAEQEPDCTDWVGTCGGSIWGLFMMQTTTIPVAFDTRETDEGWAAEPSDLLTGEPEVEVGDQGFEITYSINPDAVWSDGNPITSADFRYSALEIRDGESIMDRTGYASIEDVLTPDESTAVVVMNEEYASWRGLFSGNHGVLPAHILEGQDRNALMADGYDFSGGPWMIESWDRGVSVTLVPNENYWGELPSLDEVTFRFVTDTASAFQALQSNQVDVLFPSPQLDSIAQIEQGIQGVEVEVSPDSGNLEAIWMNNESGPLESLAVRQSIAYAIDRGAIIERVYGGLGITEPAQSFITPLAGVWGSDAFAEYSPDADAVTDLMTDDGWELNANGVWARDGETASMTLHTLAGNARRDLMVQVIQSQLGEVGFAIEIVPVSPAELFSEIAPQGNYDMGLWTLVDMFPEPELAASFASSSIPAEDNSFSGINFVRSSNADLDEQLLIVDTAVDHDTRFEASVEVDAIIAENVLSLPIAYVPNVLLWSDQVGGDISINPGQGPWWNLEAWSRVER